MNRITSVGILTSSFILFYFLEVGFGVILLKDINWFNELNESFLTLLVTLSAIFFYYSITNFFKFHLISNINEIIFILIGIGIIIYFLKVFTIIGIIIPPIIDTIIDITELIVFLVFGVKVLKLKKEEVDFIRPLKGFVISMFITFFFLSVFLIAISVINVGGLSDDNLRNLLQLVFVISYSLGLVFFIKLRIKASS